MINFPCLKCGQSLSFADEQAGSFVQCGGCGATWAVPGHVAEAAPSPRSVREKSDWKDVATAASVADEPRVGVPTPVRRRKLLVPLILGLSALLLIVIAAGGFAYWWFFWPTGLGPATKYLPDDCVEIEFQRPDKMHNSEFYKRIAEQQKKLSGSKEDDEKYVFGIPESDIAERVTAVGEKDGGVTILTMKKNIKPDYVKEKGLKGAVWKEESAGKYTIYYHDSGTFSVPEDRIILFASKETRAKILKRDSKPSFSTEFKKLMGEADFGHTQTLVATQKAGGPGVLGPGMPSQELGSTGLEGLVTHVDFGKDVSVKSVLFYKDADAAKKGLKELEEALDKLRDDDNLPMKSSMNRKNIKLSQSGSKITVKTTVNADDLIDDMKKVEEEIKKHK
jgi:hypothetical protein